MTEQKQERDQQSGTSSSNTGDDSRSQSQFDDSFSTLISGAAASVGSPDAAREAWVAYFDLAEQTLRTARRVSEVQTLSLMRQQIVSEVTAQVIATISQNPQLLQQSRQSRSQRS